MRKNKGEHRSSVFLRISVCRTNFDNYKLMLYTFQHIFDTFCWSWKVTLAMFFLDHLPLVVGQKIVFSVTSGTCTYKVFS